MQKVISRVHRIVVNQNKELHTDNGSESQVTEDDLSMEDSNGLKVKGPVLPIVIVDDQDGALFGEAKMSIECNDTTDTTLTSDPKLVPAHIIRLLDRLQYATILSERKNVLVSLNEVLVDSTFQNFSQRLVSVTLHTLSSDPRDTEYTEKALEYLHKLVSLNSNTASHLLKPVSNIFDQPEASVASSFKNRLAAAASGNDARNPIQSRERQIGLSIILDLLQDPSPWIRGPAVAVIKQLQDSVTAKDFVSAVLNCQEGLRKLFDLTFEKHEHIRDTLLQIFVRLTDNEPQVKQFIAFEDGFNRFFTIIQSEIHVQDNDSDVDTSCLDTIGNVQVLQYCFDIILHLIRDDRITQNVFRHTPNLETYFATLLQLYETFREELQPIIRTILEILQALLSVENEPTLSVQKDVYKRAQLEINLKRRNILVIQRELSQMSDLMSTLAELAVGPLCLENPTDTQTVKAVSSETTVPQIQAITLLTQIVRDNSDTQLALTQISTWHTRHSLFGRLFLVDLDVVSDTFQGAVSTLIQVLLENDAVRMILFQQMQSLTSESTVMSPLRVLLDAMFTSAHAILCESTLSDSIVTPQTSLYLNVTQFWKAIERFISLLYRNLQCKQLALRIPKDYHSPHSRSLFGAGLPTRCIRLLQHSFDSNTRPRSIYALQVGILQLLYTWTMHCQEAVREILSNAANVSILIKMMTWSHVHDLAARSSQIQCLAAYVIGNCFLYYGVLEESIAVSKKALTELVGQRIGLERYTDMLFQLPQAKDFVFAPERIDLIGRDAILKHAEEFDSLEELHEVRNESFSKKDFLFSTYKKVLTKEISEQAPLLQSALLSVLCDESLDSSESELSATKAYRDLIRMQDKEIQQLRDECKFPSSNGSELNAIATLKDECLKLQVRNSYLEEEARVSNSRMKHQNYEKRDLLEVLSSLDIYYQELQKALQTVGGRGAVEEALKSAQSYGAIPFAS